MLCLGEGGLDGLGIAHAQRDRDIVGDLVMDKRCAQAHGILSLHHAGQHLIIDGDQLSRIARRRLGRGDNHRDALANVAHTADRERRPFRAMALGAAHILRHEFGIEGAEPVGGAILPSQHGMDVRSALGGSGVDAADAGMRVRRVEEDRVGLAGQIDVRNIAGPTGQKPRILLAGDGLSDAEPHDVCPLSSRADLDARNLRSSDRDEEGRGGGMPIGQSRTSRSRRFARRYLAGNRRDPP